MPVRCIGPSVPAKPIGRLVSAGAAVLPFELEIKKDRAFCQVLILTHTILVGGAGFEPATPAV